MSIAPTKCLTAWKTWPGQPARFGQIVQTPPSGLIGGRAAGGALRGGAGGALPLLRPLRLRGRRHHLRDHVAGAHDDHLVAVAHVLAAQVLLVVERRELHGHARDLHRLEQRERDHVAGAAHVPGHLLQRGGGRGGRELPRDRPARLAAHHAELALQLEVVHLHDHAVDLEVEPVAALLPRVAGGHDLVDGVVHLHVAGSPGSRARAATRATRDACRTRARRARRSRRPTSTAAARRPAPGRAGGSSRRRSCAGSRRSARRPRRAARSGARTPPAAGRSRRAPRAAAARPPRAAGSRRSCAGSGSRPRPPRRCRAWRRARARRPRRRARSRGRRSSARSRSGRRPSRRPGAAR